MQHIVTGTDGTFVHLKEPVATGFEDETEDQFFARSDYGDPIEVVTYEHALEVLYGAYQCNDGFKEGDEFIVAGKVAFRCVSFHVIAVHDKPGYYPFPKVQE